MRNKARLKLFYALIGWLICSWSYYWYFYYVFASCILIFVIINFGWILLTIRLFILNFEKCIDVKIWHIKNLSKFFLLLFDTWLFVRFISFSAGNYLADLFICQFCNHLVFGYSLVCCFFFALNLFSYHMLGIRIFNWAARFFLHLVFLFFSTQNIFKWAYISQWVVILSFIKVSLLLLQYFLFPKALDDWFFTANLLILLTIYILNGVCKLIFNELL